jgi:tRNA threonylcarbamoyladenosine biosynthesis protein TsaB
VAHRAQPRLILALETAVEHGGVALLEGETLLGERALGAGQGQAGGVLVQLDALLREQESALEDVGLIALSIGPGSFTGLRVGLASALGLAFGTELRIAPVPTLAALSLHAGDAACSAPLLDARKGELYAGLYAPGARALAPDRVCELAGWLAGLPREGPIHLLGPGAELHREAIGRALGARAVFLSAALGRPRAASVGRLGARIAAQGGALPVDQVELRYLRPPDAMIPGMAKLPGMAGHVSGERIL